MIISKGLYVFRLPYRTADGGEVWVHGVLWSGPCHGTGLELSELLPRLPSELHQEVGSLPCLTGWWYNFHTWKSICWSECSTWIRLDRVWNLFVLQTLGKAGVVLLAKMFLRSSQTLMSVSVVRRSCLELPLVLVSLKPFLKESCSQILVVWLSGKVTNPEYQHREIPHSCGEVCGKKRTGGDCNHRCNM